MTGIKQNKCVRGCPEDSDDYSQKADITKSLPKSSPINCESLTKHLSFIEDVTISTPMIIDFDKRNSYTVTFWIRVLSTSNQTFTIVVIDGTFIIFNHFKSLLIKECFYIVSIKLEITRMLSLFNS